MVTRRTFVTATLATIAARPSFGQDRFSSLINNQYAGNVTLQQAGGSFLGYDFRVNPNPVSWQLRLARYQGRYCGNNVDLHGYWIFRPGFNKCWQAVNRGGGPLIYWNEDGHARDNPEDFELFRFAAVNAAQQTVKIYNRSYERSQTACGNHIDPNWRFFIGLSNISFNCSESGGGAAVFSIQFV